MDLHREPIVGVEQFDQQRKAALLERPPVALTDECDPQLVLHLGQREIRERPAIDPGRALPVGRDLPTLRHRPFGERASQARLEASASPDIALEDRRESKWIQPWFSHSQPTMITNLVLVFRP